MWVKVLANRPDTAGRTFGIRTGRAMATLALRASLCTRDPRFAHGPVSSSYVSLSTRISIGLVVLAPVIREESSSRIFDVSEAGHPLRASEQAAKPQLIIWAQSMSRPKFRKFLRSSRLVGRCRCFAVHQVRVRLTADEPAFRRTGARSNQSYQSNAGAKPG